MRPFSLEEVKDAIFQLGSLKTPGPDGFPAMFYQKYWLSVQDIIFRSAEEFYTGQSHIRDMNKTFIALIPKVLAPESTSQFRPISLCNTSYKILSKLLANRLKSLMPHLVSDSQNAFLADRQIHDNVIVAHEAFHYLKLKRAGHKYEVGIKIDMNKAYDRVEWDFLEALLQKLGFHSGWIRLVMLCIRTVSFSVLVNGQPGSSFLPSRGLRQGDPLSPYLFLLVCEALSCNLTKLVQDGVINGIRVSRRAPILSHLFFADDSLFFIKAEEENCSRLKGLLDDYCLASGQLINYEKSSLMFSANTPEDVKTNISSIMGIRGFDNSGIYLGIPMTWGRSKKVVLAYIRERVAKKIMGWKQGTLSMAGKEVLIKAIATAVPAYPMMCFKFPKVVCNEISSNIAKFWWGKSEGGNGIHWKSWKALCLAKGDGGLGFRDLTEFNLALLAKQSWRIISTPNALWVRILKARYYPDCEFKDAVLGHRPSWIWTSILEGRDALMGRARVQIINGADTNIWGDNWIPDNGIITPITHVPPNAPQMVSDIINLHNRTWSLDRVSSYLSWETQKQILAIPIGPSGQRDKLVWPWTSNGLYSVKSGYQCLQSAHRYLASGSSHSSHFISNRIWKAIWSVRTLPKIRMFLWRCMSNAIPTRVNLFRRKITASPMCGLCDQYEESIEHALLLCPWAQAVWFGSPMTLRIDTQSFSTLDVWLNSILDLRTESKMEKHDLLTMLSFFLWEIWKTRCKAIMEGCRIDPCKVVETASKAKVEFQKMWHGNANNETSYISISLGGMAASRVGHSALEVSWGWSLRPIWAIVMSTWNLTQRPLWTGSKGRSSNRAAHEAAAIGCRAVELESWVTQPPLSLIHVLVSDGLPGPP
ncbi:PREDICTED: uncharacterized protein LOC103341160 [Prunus mume]|uniref:Uncharacterized protein LOC103341160 n=1 Tax=Prunus mume TaxID=102107 RepID=A0ABM0PQ89_PRUMU|nr:PREDICTED: uncharacterized protein LOC103341160 [Prunus mume]